MARAGPGVSWRVNDASGRNSISCRRPGAFKRRGRVHPQGSPGEDSPSRGKARRAQRARHPGVLEGH
eukprot:6927566-Alexandrium_andersonii.AAC.1